MVLPLEVFLNEVLGIDLEESGQLVASLSGTGAERRPRPLLSHIVPASISPLPGTAMLRHCGSECVRSWSA